MELTIKANSLEQLSNKIAMLSDCFKVDFAKMPITIIAGPVVVPNREMAETVEVVEGPKKKGSKKSAPKKDVEVKVEAENKLFTKEDVMAAFKKVQETKDMETARSVLAEFKNAAGEPCKRLSEIQESDYALAVKACDEATTV